ncbi:hypothetical protein ACWEFD_34105 [Streptomyces ardesiacus]
MELYSAAKAEHQTLSDSLSVGEPPIYPATEQLAARYLGGCGRPLMPGELREALARRGHTVSAVQLKRTMGARHAFVGAPGDVWTVGRQYRGAS